MKLLLLGFTLLIMSFGLVAFTQPQLISAQANLACDGLSPNVDGGDCETKSTETEPNLTDTIKNILNLLSIIAGIIAVVMIMVAGLRFITSQGDSGKVASARNAVIYAVIGIVIVVLSQIIVQFVIGSVSTTPASEASESNLERWIG